MSVDAWTSTAFHDEATAWVRDRLADLGIGLTGEWAQTHTRTWSSTIRFETTVGRVWFKVNGPGTGHEPALLRLLAGRVPGLVPEVLAVRVDRRWSLTRDGGPLLREVLAAGDSWEPWAGVVQEYAAAQILLSADRDAVLAAGVAEVSPATVPRRARELLDELQAIAPDEGGLTADEARRLAAALPTLDSWCAELDSSPVPDSVQHDDLHSGNVCWGGSVASARIIDWGDASWGTPLATMLSTTSSIAHHAGVPTDDPAVRRVVDAYLEPFTVWADRADLARLVQLACRAGCVARALSWRAAMLGAPVSQQAERDFPVRSWLLELLEQQGA
jgi:hypothetical protein